MIDKLIELGIRDIDIKNISEFIDEDNLEDFNKILNLLVYLNCTDSTLRNIVVGNPFIMQRSYDDVYKLISYLNEIGFTTLNLLFDSYPLFLNKDSFEIRDYINKNINSKSIEDIIDEIESNPLIIEEI